MRVRLMLLPSTITDWGDVSAEAEPGGGPFELDPDGYSDADEHDPYLISHKRQSCELGATIAEHCAKGGVCLVVRMEK